MRLIRIFLTVCLMIGLSGCGAQNSSLGQPSSAAFQKAKVNPQLAQQVKEIAQSVRGVEESTTVVVDKDISTAIKVTGFQRLRLESIKQEAHQKIKEKVPESYQVYLTSDKKLFRNLQEIERQIKQRPGQAPQNIQERIKRINEDMGG